MPDRGRRRRWLPVVGASALLLAGCGLAISGPAQGCTEIGGLDGLAVRVPAATVDRAGVLSVAVEVCQDSECASEEHRLTRGSREVYLTFDDFARRFDAGPAAVKIEVGDGDGALVSEVRREVELRRSFPNGRRCDGVGYLGGSVTAAAP